MKNSFQFREFTHKISRFLTLILFTSLLNVPIAIFPQEANATLATCSATASSQNNISVEPSHPSVMYVDSGVNPKVDASYVGYRIANRTGTTMKGYWASLDNFTGGVVSLANPLDKYIALPDIAANETKTVYFLLKATVATKTLQAHDFKLWNEYPGSSTAQNKYGCNFGFLKVAETIKALANKPTATTVSTVGAIGTTFTVTSEGGTGTIGQGNPDVGRIMWFTPAAYSSFPTRAFRLESVVLKVGTKSNFGTTGGDSVRFYNERTFIKADTTPDSDSSFSGETLALDDLVGKRYYSNIYTFRVIDAASTNIVPIAQISSGTQIKHSAIISAGTGSIDSTNSVIPANISKELSSTSYSTFETPTISGTRYTAVPYKITLKGTTSDSITADQVVDVPAAGAIYKTGSTQIKIGGASAVSYANPETLTSESSLNPQPLHFIGPFTFTSSTYVVLTYTMYIPATAGTYSNNATAYIGDRRIISSTAASIPAVKVTVNGSGTVTSSETTTVKLLPDPLTKLASSIDTSTATINGTINANDTTTAGYFEWGTSPTLATYTSISLGAITGNTATAKASNLTGLSPGTTYYYRIVAVGSGVRYLGTILDLRTLDQKTTPTVTTDAPSNVSLTDATLNSTVDPNLTEVTTSFKIWRTNDTQTVDVLDDPGLVFNGNAAQASYNPASLFAGASPTSISIKMSDVATGLSSWIVAGATIYYKAIITTTTGGTVITATDTKQFTFASYNDQSIVFDPISDITWGDSAPSDSASATSGMAVKITSLTPEVCTVDASGNITIVKVGTCTLAANQAGGLKSAGVYYNAAPEVTQSFVINARPITITAAAKSKYYSDADPALTYSITSGTLVNAGDVTGSLSRAAGENVGTYLINQGTVAATANYAVTYVSANLTINQKAITITAEAKSKVYGDSDPALTATISPALKSGDVTSGSLSRAAGENIGTKLISQGTLSVSGNYSVTYVSANLTITAKPLTIKAESKTKAAGQSVPSFTYTLSGLVSPDSITAVTLTFTSSSPVYNSTTTPTADGSYVITPSSETFGTGSAGNYTITYETGTYTITSLLSQVLTWTTIPTKTYGDTATATVSSDRGLTVTVTSLTPSICTVPGGSTSGATVTLLGAGLCRLNASQAGNGTYAAATDVTTSFTIDPKPLTITATISSTPIIYGAAASTSSYTRTSLVGSDAISGVTRTFTASSPSYNSTAVPSGAGTYTLTPSVAVFSSGSSSNYTITYLNASYVINKKALTITASSHTVTEGDLIPNVTETYSTFAFSETEADLIGTIACTTTYTSSSAPGTYPTTCSGLTSDNYTITYTAGSITVNAASGSTYTVTYDLNGGSGTTPTETPKSSGQNFASAGSGGFSRSGYTFAGWSCNSGSVISAGASITMPSTALTCVAQWSANSSGSSNSGKSASPGAMRRAAVVKLITIATTPVKATAVISGSTPTPAPTTSSAPKPAPTPTPAPTTSSAPKPAPTPAPTPATTPTTGAQGEELSQTTVIPTSGTKSIIFNGSGVEKVTVVGDEVSIQAKKGFSGKTTVNITLTSEEEVSKITANVLVLPLPVTNPIVKPLTEEKTRIQWIRSPNAIGYEVILDGEVICKTTSVNCLVSTPIPADEVVQIKALGRDQTESTIKDAKYVENPAAKVIPDVALVVNFDTAKYNLDAGDKALIKAFAAEVAKYGFKEIDISGHTDSRGGIDNNILSNNRAKASRAYLLSLLPNLKVTINGFADSVNVATNATASGMAANRRAEFRVVG